MTYIRACARCGTGYEPKGGEAYCSSGCEYEATSRRGPGTHDRHGNKLDPDKEQGKKDAVVIRNMISVLKRKRPRDPIAIEMNKKETNALRRALYLLPNPYEKETP